MVAEGSAAPPSERRPLRVAIIGAGPAGIFAADALTRQDDVPVAIDLIDRLPTPFGLVRHGIAPDHPKMRAIRETLHRSLDQPFVRFVGNVDIGVDLSLEELREHVDAVVYTYGAAIDRRLGIEGEDLPGSLAATDVVAWYTGHPDADRKRVEDALADARSVVRRRRRQRRPRRGAGPGPCARGARADRHAAARPRRAGRRTGRGGDGGGPPRSRRRPASPRRSCASSTR